LEGRHVLEIQNRTPFALTWAHLERDGAPPGGSPRNLLASTVAPHRGRLVGEVEPGTCRLVCGFASDGESPSYVGPRFTLAPDAATSACVRYDAERGFAFDALDARPGDGEGSPAGLYRWNGRRGRETDKRGRRMRGMR